jgi:outer membrane protein OmpA-like peptidoglycan-associated protein
MKRNLKITLLAAGIMAACSTASIAQQEPREGQAIATSDVLSQISMFSYRDGPKSDLYFRGTPIAALAQGSAEVEYQDGNARISAKVKDLPEPASLGPYAVYVLWALTPDGRAANQGTFDGSKGKIDTSYSASQFALIVTAEPHFAVTAPSSMIALYNVADDVEGTESTVTTLIERSDYSNLTPVPESNALPIELVQARYALAIADAAGAEQFASRDYLQANEKMIAAETAQGGKRSERKLAPQLAREAVVAGEDARRAAMIGSAAAASETERLAAARSATERANSAAASARESTRVQTEADRRRAAAAAASAADRAAESAASAADQAAESAARAARADLLGRLNAALPTRDTPRGLISEIGGVQFATGKSDINASAREGVSRFSGIVASYPDLRFSVEGHTDSVGSVASNNALSLSRATAVRDYLISQGVPASSINIAGFGSSMPSGDNATAEGRARNRRVEIVVSSGPLVVNELQPSLAPSASASAASR